LGNTVDFINDLHLIFANQWLLVLQQKDPINESLYSSLPRFFNGVRHTQTHMHLFA
jgi:hypothetical protein